MSDATADVTPQKGTNLAMVHWKRWTVGTNIKVRMIFGKKNVSKAKDGLY